jgi:hypothetical protein
MSNKKKDRAWFVCRQWADLVTQHYASDIEASPALKADPKVLSRLRSGTPVAKSTLLRYCGVMLAGMISERQLPNWWLIRDYPDGPVSRSMLTRQLTDFMKS